MYFCTGQSLLAAKLLQAVVGALTCWLSYRLGMRVFDRRTGLFAGLITALCGPLIFFEGELLATGWAAFWMVALALLLMKASSSDRLGLAFLLGLCGALSVITRPTFLPALLAGGLWLVVTWLRTRHPFQRVTLRLLFVLIGVALVVTPVAVMNYHLSDHVGIMPASGGINAYIGNNPTAPETIAFRPGRDWRTLMDLPAKQGVTGGPWERQRFFYGLVRDYVVRDPAGFALGLGRKAVEFVSSREMPRSLDLCAFRQWSAILSVLVWKVAGFGFPFGVLLPLAVVGALRHARRIPAPIWLLLSFYSLSIILIFVAARYRTPLIPLIAVLAAAGCFALRDVVRERRRAQLVTYGTVIVAVIALSTLPGPFREERLNYAAELHLLLGNRHFEEDRIAASIEQYRLGLELAPDDADLHGKLGEALLMENEAGEAIGHYEAALRLRPGSAANHAALGLALIQLGHTQRAVEEYQRALEIDPAYGKAWSNLGVALQQLGRIDQAIAAYTEAVRLEPNEVITRYNLAAAHSQRGDADAAIREFERVLKISPNYVPAHHGLAHALNRQGRRDEAIAHLETALRIDPNYAPARELLNAIRR